MLLFLGSLLLAAAPQLPRLEGRVVDANGAPAGEALVCLSCQGEFLEPQTRLLARANCNGAGEFALEVPQSWVERQSYKPLTLFAWKSGHGIGAASYAIEELPVGQRISVQLAPRAQAVLEVLDPDGKPVVGARVEPSVFRLGEDMRGAPAELCAQLGVLTDAQGRATIDACPLERILELRITEAAGGVQILSDQMSHPPEWASGRVQLKPRAQVRVRASGDLPAQSSLTVTTFVFPPGTGPVRRGMAAQLESSGELAASRDLVLDAIAPGFTNLSIRWSPEEVQRPVLTPAKTEAGKECVLELVLRKGIHVRGRVVARGSGEPIAGALVRWVQYPIRFVDLATDAEGKFSVEAVSGSAWAASVSAPAPFLPMVDPRANMWTVPKDVEEFELPTIELVRGVAVKGEVRDAQGGPVPFAWVSAEAKSGVGRNAESRWLTALADDAGRFSFDSLEEGVALPIQARRGGEATLEPLLYEAHPGLPAVVTIGAAPRTALQGRVRDERGAPIAGAEVEIWREGRPNYVGDEKQVGSAPLRTDAQGRFESGRELDPETAYSVRVHASGREQVQSAWRKPDAPIELALPKLARLEGRVQDEYGKPVADATLRVRDAPALAEARTDADGRFVLENLLARRILVILEVPGAAPRGTLVDARAGKLDWKLGAPEIAAGPLAGASAPAVPRAREYEIAESLVAPSLRASIESKKQDDIYRALSNLAWIDPAGTLARCEEGLLDTYRTDIVRKNVAESLGSSAPEDAALVLGLEQGSFSRAYGLIQLADSLPPERRAQTLTLLGEAVAALRDAGSPEYELVGLSKVARSLLDLGERAQAQAFVERAAPLVEKLPTEEWAGYARTVYAEVLASFDLEKALAIVAQAKDKSEQQRHYGNIAQRIAGSNPAGAERALALAGKVEAWMEPTRWIPRVCYGMATSDLARAKRLALQGGKTPNGYALGMMALALAEQDRKSALGLLDEAYATLAAQSATAGNRWYAEEECVQAAGLLPVVEKLAPERLSEFVCRALALRRARGSGPDLSHDTDPLLVDSALALMLARYDRALARALLEPAVEYVKLGSAGLGRNWSTDVLPAALAVTDPEWALELSKSVLPPGASSTIASVLGRSGEERWSLVMNGYLHLWTVGKEDL